MVRRKNNSYGHTEETRKKIRKTLLGTKQSKKTRIKRGIALKKAYEDGRKICNFKDKPPWNIGLTKYNTPYLMELSKWMTKRMMGNKNQPMLGKKHSEKTKRKMSLAHLAEKSPFWQGGISFEPYDINFKGR